MFNKSLHPLVVRQVCGLLVAAQVMMSMPLVAQRQEPSAAARAARPVRVNKRVPVVSPPRETLEFPQDPTTQDISRALVFPEPLVPVGEADATENAELAQLLGRYRQRGDRMNLAPIQAFLDTHPNSAWRPSLLANLARTYRDVHAYTKAMALWDEAWELTKDRTDAAAVAIADQSISEWLMVAASFGQAEAVKSRYETLAGRTLRGPAASRAAEALEVATVISTYPDEVIASGPEAVRVLALAARGAEVGERRLSEVARVRPTAAGTSLAEVTQLAATDGVRLKSVQRVSATEIPVPSIVHWKLGHFSAIVERRGNAYRIEDIALGGSLWIAGPTLLEESSGAFAVPAQDTTRGFTALPAAQAAAKIGHSCYPGAPASPPPPVDAKSPVLDDPAKVLCPHMCGYRLQPETASLVLIDTPVGYAPPKGPAVQFRVVYNHRDTLQPQSFSYSNIGPMWNFEWLRFLKEEPESTGCGGAMCEFVDVGPPHVWVQMPGGGREVYEDPNADGTYNTFWRSRAYVVRTGTSPIRYERREPDGTVEVFDVPDGAAAGQRRIFLSAIIDPQGNELAFSWDEDRRLVAVTDALGQVTELAYDLTEDPLKITSVTDPFGRTAVLQYTADGQLASTTDTIGITSAYTYGAGDFVAMLTTPYGRTTFRHERETTNNVMVRMIEATDALGQTEHMEYHYRHDGLAATAPTAQVPSGFTSANANLDHWNTLHWTKQAWQASPGNLANAVITHWNVASEIPNAPMRAGAPHSVKRPLEGRVWFAYPDQSDPQGLSWTIKPSTVARKLDDGSTQAWQYTYNTAGHLLTSIDPLGRRMTYTYDSNLIDLLTVKQTTGALNDSLVTFSDYTADHKPETIVDAAGETITLTYNSAGQVLTVTNQKSEVTTYTYDSDGYLTGIAGPVSGADWALAYDSYGRVATVTNPDDDDVTATYDLFDRLTSVTYPDSTTEVRTYDRLDLASVTDRQGRITRFYYDPLGRLTATRDPLGRTVQQQWCSCNAPSKLIDGLGQVTSWTRDIQGRVLTEVRESSATTTYAYQSLAGRLATVTDPAAQVKTYAYALDDALTSVTYTNATVSTATESFTYDSNYARLTGMSDGSGSTAYTYKAVGTLGAGQVATIDGPLSNDTLAYTYDELGRVNARTVNSVGLTWAYDALGRLTSEVNPLGTFSYTYDAETGRPSSSTYPNGQTSTYTYFGGSGNRRLQTLQHKLSGGANLSKFDYTYDAVGNILSWQQQVDSNAAIQWTYGYDGADQLLTAVKRAVASPYTIQAQYGYRYDAGANRTGEQVDGVLTGSTYDRRNRLTSQQATGAMRIEGTLSEAGTVTIDGQAVTVDASHRFEGTKTIASGSNSFTVVATDGTGNSATKIYDLTASGSTRTLTHDANGNLTDDGTKTYEWDAANRLTAVVNGTHRSEMSYDGLSRRIRIVEKTSGTTTNDARFIWVGGAIVEERLSTGVINRFFRDGEQHNGNSTFVTRDHLGSVREVTSSGGTLLTRNDYDPYGQLTRIGGSEDSRFAYTGHYAHETTGLALALYRAYSPDLGRWLSNDPAQFVDGPNLYAYVAGNPTNLTDPSGLACDPSNRQEYWDRYLEHLSKYLIDPSPYALPLLLGAPIPKGWVGAQPLLGSTNQFTTLARWLALPGATNPVARRLVFPGIGVATVGLGFYNVGVIVSGLAYAAWP